MVYREKITMLSEIVVEERIEVKEACRKFIAKSDELLAAKLQHEEWKNHHNQTRSKNSTNRMNIQESLVMARELQDSEINSFSYQLKEM
jgi:hypothetical protein